MTLNRTTSDMIVNRTTGIKVSDEIGVSKGSWSIWEEFEQRLVNVRWYGADPTGVNDSTQAIKDAIASISSQSSPQGGIVFFPKGTYKVTSTITLSPGIYFKGVSRRSTKIQSHITNGTRLFDLPLPATDNFGSSYFSLGFSDLRIEGYGTDGAGTGCGNGLSIADANKVSIDRVDIVNFPDATGFYYRSGAFHSLIKELEISNCKIGADFNGGTGNPNHVTMIHMIDSAIGNCKTASLNVYECVNISFTRCTIQDATDTTAGDFGIGALVQNSEIVEFNNCWFERTVKESVKLRNCDHVRFNGGQFASAGYTGGAVGTENTAYRYINVVGTSKNVHINEVFFYERAGSDIEFGANVSRSIIYLPTKRDGSEISVVNSGTNNRTIRKITTGLTFNGLYEANEFRASTTNGYAFVGADGSDYQLRTDSNRKPYIRRNNDGIVRATGDVHYGGSTANRPTSPLQFESFFDTTLNKPIQWNGTAWVDAMGTVV